MISALVLALSLGAYSPRPVEETYALRFRPVLGESWALRAALEVNTSDQATSGTALLTLKVGEVRADGSYDLTATLTGIEITTAGKTTPLEDQSTDMTCGANGGVTLVRPEDAESPPDILGTVGLSFAPPAPVRVGESWDAVLPASEDGKRVRFTLVGPERKYDRDLLRLEVKGPYPGLGTVSGSVWVDGKTFRFAAATLRADGMPEVFGKGAIFAVKYRPEV